MLVLSRRTDEKIVLPTVPAVIQVVAATSGLVKLGIKAPSGVPILREELCSEAQRQQARSLQDKAPGEIPSLDLQLRNRLNNVILGLALLRMRLQVTEEDVRKNLDGIDQELQMLCGLLASQPADKVFSSAVPLLAPSCP